MYKLTIMNRDLGMFYCNVCGHNVFIQIFSRYEKHRDLILEDIFASLRRLPTTKRNLRSFKSVGMP